jgi:hypothetical protein
MQDKAARTAGVSCWPLHTTHPHPLPDIQLLGSLLADPAHVGLWQGVRHHDESKDDLAACKSIASTTAAATTRLQQVPLHH